VAVGFRRATDFNLTLALQLTLALPAQYYPAATTRNSQAWLGVFRVPRVDLVDGFRRATDFNLR
jgi:hypothetical protein